jgi:RimJ/RimL family protein N-acetyltransferase
MVEITVTTVKELDLRKLSKFMYDARKNTVFDTKTRTLEHIYENQKEITSDDNMILAAYENEEIIGIFRIYTGFPEMAFSSNWDPIITQKVSRERREEIAIDLINHGKEFVKEKGFSRLEILLSPLTEKHSKIYEENKSWNEKAGFYKATEEVHMQVDLNKLELQSPQPELNEGLRFESFANISNDRIEGPFFKSFTDSGDGLFLDMNHAQRKVTFNYWLRRNQPFHRSSIVVMKGNAVIGLNVVRQDGDKAEIGPVAIIPEFKRQGVMTTTLYESLKRMQEDGLKIGQLEADALNEPAIKLYKKYGFKTLYTQEYFAWKVD